VAVVVAAAPAVSAVAVVLSVVVVVPAVSAVAISIVVVVVASVVVATAAVAVSIVVVVVASVVVTAVPVVPRRSRSLDGDCNKCRHGDLRNGKWKRWGTRGRVEEGKERARASRQSE
jgi:hypothetical protein